MANLIFDYDGTLHESLYIYAPAFRLGYPHLVRKGLIPDKDFSDTGISSGLIFPQKTVGKLDTRVATDGKRFVQGSLAGDDTFSSDSAWR
ncbi:hypothetical protein ACRQU7_01245 [Caproiciproducens sp. R1]|uniref:hypothetical protein n=1 Tax=Caproiciproducens sp. R1 TaxID=3435000 RepID=UPI0040337055